MTDRQKFALQKAAAFCAYQERTVKETRQRLCDWELSEEEIAWVLEELKAQNYLNEERFARAFAGGKFRVKKWGRLKIRQEMKLKGVPNDLIQKGLTEIDGDDYEAVLRDLLEKKARGLKGESVAVKQKLVRFALSRGFESDIVWELLKTLGAEKE
ncbi:regulatory protein RecX [Runella slithyformis]|uniref:Regulatory protein RecX n=1 Tax=Runella slithyformis (strain ATCC 29530 / DSM 19594 / LMG 11500 / NCIMB 11436 / LSU 4) TaxID=761193 RepID=A0A7U3ZJF5_RUNSL|nr:regulatory protein RecX [Runella slithyformis]AEI48297.1 Regulatory protein recX [Runella slithyformis DSM 19594]